MDYHGFCGSPTGVYYAQSMAISSICSLLCAILHRYTARKLGDERMWPLSMPLLYCGRAGHRAGRSTAHPITGRFKTLYREGLKNRYGALMQTISGVHYNFSLPDGVLAGEMRRYGRRSGKRKNFLPAIFRLIRNYYRFWLGHPLSVLARLRPFVPLSCKESQPHYRFEKNGLRHVLPAVCDVAAFE
ncbi:gamma-glutamylcysteine synthetase [Salmonella enterica subsp. enterica]|uniref:Glutamate--cysteine ligase n=1 Tax=Salmonella enterica I TaxID=59201 RepID=A0A447TX41_SALET|nr:gamma-glutamylcysteine synthetase [Salmonella enterica subsp. enterica]